MEIIKYGIYSVKSSNYRHCVVIGNAETYNNHNLIMVADINDKTNVELIEREKLINHVGNLEPNKINELEGYINENRRIFS